MAQQLLSVIKIGGNILDDEVQLASFLNDFAQLPGPKILVHGGGKLATRLGNQLGIESKFIDGRRVTHQETLDLGIMVYAGLINKQLVARLQALKTNALGLCGADGLAIKSTLRKKEPIDFGLVGDVHATQVNVAFISGLLKQSITPIFSAITCTAEGQLLNSNADGIARALALALKTEFQIRLVYCFEKPGVLRDPNQAQTVIPIITPSLAQQLQTEGIITDGMIPKIQNALEALQQGVMEVHIGHASALKALSKGEAVGSLLRLQP